MNQRVKTRQLGAYADTLVVEDDALALADPTVGDDEIHVLGAGIVCDTERRGHPEPKRLHPAELVLDATEGFIPLWASGTTLKSSS